MPYYIQPPKVRKKYLNIPFCRNKLFTFHEKN